MANESRQVASFSITTAGTQVSEAFKLKPGTAHITAYANFNRGSSGGTSAKAYLQTTVDGTNWFDIMSFAFTTTTAARLLAVAQEKNASVVTPSDAALTDGTAVSGLFGESYRVKLASVGTYVGPATLTIDIFEGE